MLRRFLLIAGLLWTCFFTPCGAGAAGLVRHDLKVRLVPSEHRIQVEDRLTLPEDFPRVFEGVLHGGFEVHSPTRGVRLEKEENGKGPISFRLILPNGIRIFQLVYGGTIDQPPEATGKEYARGFKVTPGIISKEGIYLAADSLWYPRFGEEMISFTLEADLPPGWDAVSQGARTLHKKGKERTRVRWECPEAQEEIYLVAAPFIEYDRPAGSVEAMAFLRSPDEGLADRYLEATGRYLSMYDNLIGPYPYKKFALVENFWETGYGMPSFTLLGSRIIRFPFILYTSYPHEILHNWWGNCVYPDYGTGNWSEGLTAYLSDHLLKEQQGQGAEYRQTTLQKYADYVSSGKDFPLSRFRSRHSSSSEAVGYGKGLMFFHMLRRELGDALFVEGLRNFYREFRFRKASFDDLRKGFEKFSHRDLSSEFHLWVEKPGAPMLRISNGEVRREGKSYRLTAVLEQVQSGETYPLSVPLAVTLAEKEKAFQTVVRMKEKRSPLRLTLPARPLRIDVDPEFDLFRRLARAEIPPALSQTLGAKKVLFLLPGSADKNRLSAYREFARTLGHAGPDEVEVRLDGDVRSLPSDRAVILLGWGNRYLPTLSAGLSVYGDTLDEKGLTLGKKKIPKEDHAVVLTIRHPGNKDLSLTWVGAARTDALPGLGRKLPHYHKYSYLAFEGAEPVNKVKGRWPVLDSPLTLFFPGRNGTVRRVERGKLAARSPLAELPPVFSGKRMMKTVRFLASKELRGRGLGTKELDLAAAYIAEKFREAGLEPAGDEAGNFFQTWEASFGDPEHKGVLRNVIGVIPGTNPAYRGQSVVLGAHYDHLGLGWPDVHAGEAGKIHFGADDNASGVSVLLELARVLGKNVKPQRTLVFAAFTGEEAGRLGSMHYVAEEKRYPAKRCIGMVNLDTVGRLGKRKLLVLGSTSATEWKPIFQGAGYVTGVDLDLVTENLDSSDHVSFQEAGVPAVQLFSGVHLDYHRPSDTADKIDPGGLVKVASVAREVIVYLGDREEPMTSSLTPGKKEGRRPKEGRKVSLGTIPDFSYTGKGCRISGVVPGAPAETCGLKEGDVIVRIDNRNIHSLKDLADALRTLSPGDRIMITFLREGQERTVKAEVRKR